MTLGPLPITAVARPLTWFTRSYLVTSILPASLPVTSAYILLASGAWSGAPDWRRPFAAVHDLAAESTIWLVAELAVVCVVVSVLTQPLHAWLRRLVVGDWGDGLAGPLYDVLIAHHLRRATAVELAVRAAGRAIPPLEEEAKEAQREPDDDLTVIQRRAEYYRLMRMRASYPSGREYLRPTRLGNLVSRYQTDAGLPYRLDLLAVEPMLRLVADAEHVQLVDDARLQYDLAVRLYGSALLTTAVCLGWLWRTDVWLLLALVPYLASIPLQMAATAAASEYYSAVEAVMHVDRQRLYTALQLSPVFDTDAERKRNLSLAKVLNKEWSRKARAEVVLDYADSHDDSCSGGTS